MLWPLFSDKNISEDKNVLNKYRVRTQPVKIFYIKIAPI